MSVLSLRTCTLESNMLRQLNYPFCFDSDLITYWVAS